MKVQRVGEFVRFARISKRLSCEQVARRTGIRAETIAKMERGRSEAAFYRWLKICSALGIDPMQALREIEREEAA